MLSRLSLAIDPVPGGSLVDAQRGRRILLVALAVATLLKFALAAALPLTGDEVYFFLWGKYPDYGYYDHPPMVGWWLAGLLTLGQSEWWLRLPAIVLNTAIAWGIYTLLRQHQPERRARLVAILYLLAPVNVVNVLITTDTPLILFSFLSALALHRAVRSGRMGWFAVAGLCLGLALLSKYFAGLLALAFAVTLLALRPSRRNLAGLLIVALVALPFMGLNLWWNYEHCWNNFLFNFMNRHEHPHADWRTPLLFLALSLYTLTPGLMWRVWQARRAGLAADTRLFAWLWLLPMAALAALSIRTQIGLHWLLSFYPFFFIGLTSMLDEERLHQSIRFMAGFSALHLAVLAVLLLLPLQVWKPGLRDSIALGTYSDRYWAQIEPLLGDATLATRDYVRSAILEYRSGRHVPVFGMGSKYARQDDQLTDFRQYDGRDIALLLADQNTVPDYARFFDRHEVRPIVVKGVPQYLLLGKGFRYAQYREEVLLPVREQYYRRPAILSCAGCAFEQRYFADTTFP